jgi:hypothetical protein
MHSVRLVRASLLVLACGAAGLAAFAVGSRSLPSAVAGPAEGPSAVLGYSTDGVINPFKSVNAFQATNTSVAFSLDAPATVLVEFGGWLRVAGGGPNTGAAVRLGVGVDGALPAGRRATLNCNRYAATFHEASASTMATVSLPAGKHTLALYGMATELQCLVFEPWLKVTKP